MAIRAYTTSIVVDFKSDISDSSILTAEVDSRESGYNKGRTTFVPGSSDIPVFLIFKSSAVSITVKDTSMGQLATLGYKHNYEVSDYILFSNEKEKKLSYPIYSGFSAVWMGDNGGNVSHTEDTIRIPNNTVGVLKVSYTAQYEAIELHNIPSVVQGETEFPVLIYIAGEA